jgi:3-phosphoshikimate 1-carboxyvinyltransferase
MSVLELDARRLHPARLQPPVSKSDAIRALTLAKICGLARPDVGDDPPQDVEALQKGLDALAEGGSIDCGDGAGPFRVLLGQAAVRKVKVVFTGSARLAQRPHEPLVGSLLAALEGVGLRIEGTPWPLRVEGTDGTDARRFRVGATASSQFPSSLLLASARRVLHDGRPWTVQVDGPMASAGYLQMTIRWLHAAGFPVRSDGDEYVVSRERVPDALPRIPKDWSAGAYLMLAAWRGGGAVAGLDLTTDHPDRAIVRHLQSIGLGVTGQQGDLSVGGSPSSTLHASAQEVPDLIPTLVALACVLPGPSVFTDIGILSGKESDRVSGIIELAHLGGADVVQVGDILRVLPNAAPATDLHFQSRGDHRMAMAAATLAILLGRRLRLEGWECVRKSFPGFFSELARMGVAGRTDVA